MLKRYLPLKKFKEVKEIKEEKDDKLELGEKKLSRITKQLHEIRMNKSTLKGLLQSFAERKKKTLVLKKY